MKIIIAGSREFENYAVMQSTLYPLFEKYHLLGSDTTIISGTARGADRLGERFARDNDLSLIRMAADWETHGKKAGFIRNTDMSNEADMVVCFTNGSKGTGHMINIAVKKGLPTFVYDFAGNLLEEHHVSETP